MTIRLIVRTDDAAMAANIGGAVDTRFRTFDIEAPILEAYLRAGRNVPGGYVLRQVVGAEVVGAEKEA